MVQSASIAHAGSSGGITLAPLAPDGLGAEATAGEAIGAAKVTAADGRGTVEATVATEVAAAEAGGARVPSQPMNPTRTTASALATIFMQ